MSFAGGNRGPGFSGKRGESEGDFVVLPEIKQKWKGDVLNVELQGEPLHVSIGAGSLCDAVSTALLIHHSNAIKAGRRPGGASQAPLDPDGGQGRLAKEGKRPSARGFTGKAESLPNVLTRSPISLSKGEVRIGGSQRASGPRQKGRRGPTSPNMGFSATATIRPANALHEQWLVDEAALGHEYFSVVGESDHVVTKVVADYLATVVDGTRYYEKRRFQARDV